MHNNLLQSYMPCFCMMEFCISQRVGYDKNYLRLHYHEALASDTLIASGLLGIEKERTSIVLHKSLKAGEATTCIPLLPGGYFLSYVAFESWVKNVFPLFVCSHFESRWPFLENFRLRSMLRQWFTRASCLTAWLTHQRLSYGWYGA